MIEIEINNQLIKAENGEKLIAVCDRENIAIPRFCYHKDLSIAANCRMCLIEIENNPKPQPACSTGVYAGMKVNTENKKVKDSQQAVMEFLLINHPLDCPVCDQGGECELQDVAIDYGSTQTFFSEGKRVVNDKDIGPLIHTELTRCIHCTRCVRFGDEVAGVSELGMLGRGEDMSIATFLTSGVDSELSGNMIDICPVGALTSKPFQFMARSWEMTSSVNIARHDLLGSNLNIQAFENKVCRIAACENAKVNGVWISDRDRFSYTSLTSKARNLSPKIKVDGTWKNASWQEALDFAADGLKGLVENNKGEKLASLTSSTATLEEMYLLKKLTAKIGGECEYRLGISDLTNYSYLDSTIKTSEIKDFENIIILGCNPRFAEPLINYQIRKSSLAGGKIQAIIQAGSDFNYPVIKNITPSANFNQELEKLSLDEKSLVVIGAEIHQTNTSKINATLQKSGVKILNISTSGNTIGARKVGFVGEDIYHKNAYIMLDLGTQDLTKKLTQSIENADFVVSIASFDSLDDLADVSLPLAGLYETSGTFININELVQSFSASVKPPGEAKAGWKIIKVLADLLGVKGFEYISSVDVKNGALNFDKIIDEIEIKADIENNEILQKTMYEVDEYTRNSNCLQQTNLGK